MAMILPEKIEETMDEWPTFWAGRPARQSPEASEILANLKILWSLITNESLSEEAQEHHFKALWILGYELSRDRILSRNMFRVPIKFRIKNMIEDGGPLLFGYYTSDDESHFENCCVTLERVLRRASLWEEYSQQAISN